MKSPKATIAIQLVLIVALIASIGYQLREQSPDGTYVEKVDPPPRHVVESREAIDR